jgi:rhamnose transport system substrate-binding protein
MNKLTVSALALSAALWGGMVLAEAVKATPGMVLLPKFLGILVFDQANEGAQEAHAELGNPGELLFTGPDARKLGRGPDRDHDHRRDQGQAR